MLSNGSLSRKWVVLIVFGFFVFDVLSLAAYTFPVFNWCLLPFVIFFILYCIARDERNLLVLPLAELTWGSFGSELQWQMGSFHLSLRILLFICCVGFWAWKRYQGRFVPLHPFQRDALQYVLLAAPAAWAVLRGIALHHPLGTIFFDGNAYLYLLYIPLWHLVYDRKAIPSLRALFMGAALALSIKTLLLMNIFTNQYQALNVEYLYIWIRDTRVGEITATGSAIWRIFIQSQLFIGIAIMHACVEIVHERKMSWLRMTYVALLFAGLISSMSRSFWIGLFVALSLVMVLAVVRKSLSFMQAIQLSLRLFMSILISLFLIVLFIFIPYGGKDIQGALSDRLSANDAAGTSRAQLLGPLMQAIRQSPFIGQGFGATVTYHSNDPRIKNPSNPTGIVTTDAFEWGYLDQWLKWGLLGMLLWAFVIARQYYRGMKIYRTDSPDALWAASLLAGLTFILFVHVVSPYLNHPLGIGYVLLTMLVLQHSVEPQRHA